MELTPEHIDYIFEYYGRFMNDDEYKTLCHHSTVHQFGERALNSDFCYKIGWMTKDENILQLLDKGILDFRATVAKRIYEKNWINIFFNDCPNCGKLARTPDAKQCRYCRHDWHST